MEMYHLSQVYKYFTDTHIILIYGSLQILSESSPLKIVGSYARSGDEKATSLSIDENV